VGYLPEGLCEIGSRSTSRMSTVGSFEQLQDPKLVQSYSH